MGICSNGNLHLLQIDLCYVKGVVVHWCTPLTLNPEQLGGVDS